MKIFVGILLILPMMMLTLVPTAVGQENENENVRYTTDTLPEFNIFYTTIIGAPIRTTAKPCPEGQRLNSRGKCRTVV